MPYPIQEDLADVAWPSRLTKSPTAIASGLRPYLRQTLTVYTKFRDRGPQGLCGGQIPEFMTVGQSPNGGFPDEFFVACHT